MPLPKPTNEQTRDEFLSSCMGDEVMTSEYPDKEQRYAVCVAQWDKNKKEKMYKYGKPCSEIKDLDLKNRMVQAYYFNAESVDSDNDIISIDAYNKSIAERGPKSSLPRIKHLFNHWEAAGTLQELGTDQKGGWFISKLGRHTVGRDVLAMYEDGIITEHSHGFETVKSDNETIEGKEIRRIKEGILWEVTSLDKWGANMNTPIIKSLEDQNEWIKKLDKLERAIQRGNYSDETFEVFELQVKQIKEMIRQFEKPEQLPTPQGAGGVPTLKRPQIHIINPLKIKKSGLQIQIR